MRKVGLVSSVGLGEFAFEKAGDGADAIVPERGQAGELELAEHSGGDVVGRGAAVTAQQQVERAVHPADAETVAVKQQVSFVREPLHSDRVQCLSEPEGGVGRARALGVIGVVLLSAEALLKSA